MMKAWVSKADGSIFPFEEGSETPGYAPDTHDLIDCPQELIDGTHDWDPATRSCVLPPAPKGPEQISPGLAVDALIALVNDLQTEGVLPSAKATALRTRLEARRAK
jgi:hypothetical protein